MRLAIALLVARVTVRTSCAPSALLLSGLASPSPLSAELTPAGARSDRPDRPPCRHHAHGQQSQGRHPGRVSPVPLLSMPPHTYPNALEHPNGELKRHGVPAAHPRKRFGNLKVQGGVSRLALRQGFAQSPQSIDPLVGTLHDYIWSC